MANTPNGSMIIPKQARKMIDAGALVAISTSGGKDSQAMTIILSELVPLEQVIFIHAPLGRVEWPGTTEHIQATIPSGRPLLMAEMASGKTLLERVEERGQFPDPARRWCTSDFKRGPIRREIRRYLKAHPEHQRLVIDCQGMRAEESSQRARRAPWRRLDAECKAGREWYEWLPIHDLRLSEVWRVIRTAGQEPHEAYKKGMSRLSCSFCIMASQHDLRTAAGLRPDLYQEYVELEERINHTLSPSRRRLKEIVEGDSSQYSFNLETL